MFGHDDELPGGLQDTDLEMAELQATARRESALKRRGICRHGWRSGPPGPPSKPTTVWTCRECGQVFASEAAMDADRKSNFLTKP